MLRAFFFLSCPVSKTLELDFKICVLLLLSFFFFLNHCCMCACAFIFHYLFSVEQKNVTQGLRIVLSDEGGRYMASEKQVSNNLNSSVLKDGD